MAKRLQPGTDERVIPFRIEGTDLRGQIVKFGTVVQDVLSRHDYPPPVSQLLGEALVLTALLGASLKFEGKLILQVQGNGPVRLLVCDYVTDGSLRGYARVDNTFDLSGETASVSELFGEGHLALTVDQGLDKDRYQGIVALEGETLEACALRYFAQSEQIPTLLKLAVAKLFVPGEDMTWRAGGLLVQKMPDEGGDFSFLSEHAEEDWERIAAFVLTTEVHELIDPQLTSPELLYRLFHEDGVRVFEPKSVTFSCNCSRDKIEQLLQSFSPEERQDMREGNIIKVRCEFCNAAYEFDPDKLSMS